MKESMCHSGRRSPELRDIRARRFASTQRIGMASRFSKAPICSSLPAGRATPTESDSSRPESNSTSRVVSRSTSGRRLPHESERLLVAVQDSGVGIDRENLGKIFDPFYTTKPHGGRLWAVANEDRDATF